MNVDYLKYIQAYTFGLQFGKLGTFHSSSQRILNFLYAFERARFPLSKTVKIFEIRWVDHTLRLVKVRAKIIDIFTIGNP